MLAYIWSAVLACPAHLHSRMALSPLLAGDFDEERWLGRFGKYGIPLLIAIAVIGYRIIRQVTTARPPDQPDPSWIGDRAGRNRRLVIIAVALGILALLAAIFVLSG